MAGQHSALGELIIEGLEEAIAYERGEAADVRVHQVEVTARKAHLELPPYYPPYLVREIWHKLSVSQAIFAQMLGVIASSVRAWEQGKREPDGPARRLLQIADSRPEVLKEVCGEIYPATGTDQSVPRSVAVAVRSGGPKRLAADTDSSRPQDPRG